MSSFVTFIFLVAAVFLLTSGMPSEDFTFLEECNEICDRYPEATCQLRCLRIIEGEGHDCINTFIVNNETVFCFP